MKYCPVCNHTNADTATKCENCLSAFGSSPGIAKTVFKNPADFTIEEGDVIAGRYRIIRKLGEGGMGVVYLVEDILMDEEECALKIIYPALVANPEARQRFKTEVSTSRKLRHPAIIQVFDIGQSESHYYFSMEYLDGKSLARFLRERQGNMPPFSLAEIGRVMTPLLTGLAYAHKHRSIHRDIKPDNIMVLGGFPDVEIKILDFGIARTMSTARFTQTNQGLGTPYYMAPEQLENAHGIDHRADLFGAGMILYEMLTGKRAMGRFKLPSELLSPSYTPLDEVVVTSLSPDPADRYADAAEMLTHLEDALDTSGSRQEKPEQKKPNKKIKETKEIKEKPASAPAPKTASGRQQSFVKYGIIGGLLAALALGLVLRLLPGEQPPTETVTKTTAPAQKKTASPTPEEQQQQKITARLAECSSFMSARKWNKAHGCFESVLQQDAANKEAASGLRKIISLLADQGQQALQKDDLQTAVNRQKALASLGGKPAAQAAHTLARSIAAYKQQKQKEQEEQEKRKQAAAALKRQQEKEKEIATALATCSSELKKQQWAAAHACYQQVLHQDRDNAAALSGLESVYAQLLALGKQALGNDDLEAARQQLGQLSSLTGGEAARAELSRLINDFQNERAEKEQQLAEQKRQEAEAQRKAELAASLARCRKYLQNNALTTPKEANAYTCFTQVLADYEDNPEALQGLEQIKQKYLSWGLAAVESGRVNRAKQQLSKLEGLADTTTEQEELRTAIAAYEEQQARTPKAGDTYTDPTTGMEFVYVKGGSFYMGQTRKEKKQIIAEAGEKIYNKYFSSELPRHQVRVDGFWMGRYEVTVGQWRKFIRATGYRTDAEKNTGKSGCFSFKENKWDWIAGRYWDDPGFTQSSSRPVACVSYNDVAAYIDWLNKKTTSREYRLPTEAEWEYAARGGTRTIRFWGDDTDSSACRYANVADKGHGWRNPFPCVDGYKWAAPVGSFQPNSYGLYDMLGNVWEWCSDWYDEDYYKSSPRSNPQGPSSGSNRVVRGGSWFVGPWHVRAANRLRVGPATRIGDLGFRLVFSEGPVE